jgi:hypothetical protein
MTSRTFGFLTIVPLLLISPAHALFSGLYAYSVKLAADDDTYRTYCKKQRESLRVIAEYCGYYENEYENEGNPKD